MKRLTGISSTVAAALLVAACANTYQAPRPAAPPPEAAMIGMPKSVLLTCAGTPSRTEAKADAEYLTYLTGTPPPVKPPQTGSAPTSASVGTGYCRMTFVLRKSAVESITLAGPSARDLPTNPDCLRIVDKCVVR